MATWDDQDVNNPELYKPRPNPKVKKAPGLRILNASGEFAMPPKFSKGGRGQKDYDLSAFDRDPYDDVFDRDPYAAYGPGMEEGPAESQMGDPPAEDGFHFDENLRWDMPLSDVPLAVAPRPSAAVRRLADATGPAAPPKSTPRGKAAQAAGPAKRTGPQGKAGSRGRVPGGNGGKGGGTNAGGGPGSNGGGRKGSGKGFFQSPYLYVGIITACTLALAFVVVMMMPQVAGYFWRDFSNYAFINGEILTYNKEIVQNYTTSRDYLTRSVIYPGVFVDGVHVGDMTLDEAQSALSGTMAQAKPFALTVAIGNKTWPIDSSNVPATRDLGNVLEQAYAIGRSNTTAIRGTQITPFRERVDQVMKLRESGVNLVARAAYDHEAVRKLVDEIVTFVTRPPIDAALKNIDTDTHTLLFTDEQVGVTVDGEALYQRVTAALDNWQENTTITVEPVLTQPAVTKAQLTASFTRISAYTTDTTNDKNRNNNINLACQAITSTALMPGEVFSFNAATGQRTTDKGYREAGAIAAGQSIEEVGGGICQVSSTLFNAVARADLEIVSRSPHAWPSTYVNRGEDATVNWPNLDFKFKNNKSTPVYLVTYYKDRKCSAEIWGFPMGEGLSIDLKSTVVKTMDPPLDVLYVVNPNLPYGTSKETIKPRTGYVVDTYKVWYQNGKEIKSEKMQTSTYKAYQRTIEYN